MSDSRKWGHEQAEIEERIEAIIFNSKPEELIFYLMHAYYVFQELLSSVRLLEVERQDITGTKDRLVGHIANVLNEPLSNVCNVIGRSHERWRRYERKES